MKQETKEKRIYNMAKFLLKKGKIPHYRGKEKCPTCGNMYDVRFICNHIK